jgi:hypothetical protein
VFRRVRALTCTDPVSCHWRTHWPIIFLGGDHHQISDETLAAQIQLTCSTQTVPHKICAAARINVPLFTESKTTRNPTTIVSDPFHNPHKQFCQLKMGNFKCRTLYIWLYVLYAFV